MDRPSPAPTVAAPAPRKVRRLLMASVAVAALASPAVAAELPLTRVVLSTSGLAQFTHAGPITGGSTIDLPVRLDQVDDILKSLTVFDALGSVGTVSLPGREPLAELFRDLPFDRLALQSPADLVNALVGSEVEISGPVNARGRIFQVEPETVVLGEGRGTTTRHRLSLLTDKGLVQAVFEDITALSFTEAQTRGQIDRAFAGLVENRAKDRRRLSIGLLGQGNRDVAIGYVVAAPIWKTSWRLVLPKDGTKDATKDGAKARIQGWAVLENLTGGDWKDIDLTLVSGNPVALTQPLYASVYGNRETIPVAGSASPPVVRSEAMPARKAAMPMRAPAAQDRAGRAQAPGRPAPAPMVAAAEAPAMAAGGVAAEAEEAATQLLYRFPSRVSLATGHTMMVPFVDREIRAERIWLYQPEANARRPFATVRLRNDGETGLPPGIVTTFEVAADGTTNHVGDTLMPLLPRGSQKLMSFALDSKTDIKRDDRDVTRTTLGTAVDGKLTTTVRSRHVIAYEISAPPEEDREIVIEEDRDDDWKPAADIKDIETTPTKLRWKVAAAKGKTTHAELVLERTDSEVVTLASLPAEDILARVRGLENGGPALKEAVDRLAEVVGDIARARTQKAQLDGERKKIADDQERIRKNLQSAGAASDLGRRYLDTLRQQEDRLAEMVKTDQSLDETIATRRRTAADMARKLKL